MQCNDAHSLFLYCTCLTNARFLHMIVAFIECRGKEFALTFALNQVSDEFRREKHAFMSLAGTLMGISCVLVVEYDRLERHVDVATCGCRDDCHCIEVERGPWVSVCSVSFALEQGPPYSTQIVPTRCRHIRTRVATSRLRFLFRSCGFRHT